MVLASLSLKQVIIFLLLLQAAAVFLPWDHLHVRNNPVSFSLNPKNFPKKHFGELPPPPKKKKENKEEMLEYVE